MLKGLPSVSILIQRPDSGVTAILCTDDAVAGVDV